MTGQADVLPELREACESAVGWLLAAAPDAVTVIGPGTATATWPPDSLPDLPGHVPALSHPERQADAPAVPVSAPPPELPLSLAIGAQLLDAAGYSGPRILQSVAESATPDDCLDLGRDLAADAPLTALLVIGDGSARRSAAAPGYLDERAEPFDTVVEQAVRDGDLPALAALDPDLARDLLAAGRPAWQALAGALAPTSTATPARPSTRILYSDAPFGVAYLVATLDPAS